MNSTVRRNSIRAALFATTLLATTLFAGTANAQFSTLEGKFTLQQETHWGGAVLPPGNYRISVASIGSPTMLVVRSARTDQTVAMVSPQNTEDARTGETALLIGMRGTQRVIHSFRVAELGVVFISDSQLAHGRGIHQEVGKTQAVPVIVAKK